MKKHQTILVLLNILLVMQSQANINSHADTLKGKEIQSFDVDSFSYKIGVKFMSEASGDYSFRPLDFQVYNAGIQVIRPFSNTRSSIESGLYLIVKASEYDYVTREPYQWGSPPITYYNVDDHPILIHYKNLSIPINYRLDGNPVYFSAGVMVDYLVSKDVVTYKEYLDSIDYNHNIDRKLNWGYNLNVGAEKSVSNKLSFFVELRFAQTLSSSKSNRGSFFYHPSYMNYGFVLGMNYKFYKQCR